MNMIDRYLDAVVRRLPPQQRAGATRQLRDQIEMKLQQRTGGAKPQDSDIEAVLVDLGDPRLMADQYRGSRRFLIGPDYFETYWLILRIVLLASGFGILVATVVRLVANPPDSALAILAEFGGGLYNALLGGLGMVTLIFALIEYFNPQIKEQLRVKKAAWSPAQLPDRPAASLIIKRSEPIVTIIFLAIFTVIINTNQDLIGIYYQHGDSYRIVPVLSDYFRQFIPWINLSLAIAFIVEGIKLIIGRWTILLVIVSLAQKAVSLIVSLWILADPRFFNPLFFAEIRSIFNMTQELVPADIAVRVCSILIIVSIVGFIVDVLTTGWKAVRIALEKSKST